MPNLPNEDLFEGTKMSFGEHLEELRACLFRALIGLLLGFLIGMGIAKYVVRFIQRPLVRALEDHYVARSLSQLEGIYGDDTMSPEMVAFVKATRAVFRDVYIEEAEIARLRGRMANSESLIAGQVDAFNYREELPQPAGRIFKTRIWQRLDPKITTLNAQEAFMVWLKAAFASGLVIASPYIFYQIWVFVAAGLYPHEKHYVYLFLPFSLVLFWSGASMAFFFAFKYVLDFLLSFNRAMDIESEPRISEWISFVLMLPIGFGIAFQLPLVMLFLNRIGIFSVRAYLEKWRIAVLVIFTLSMVLTPADPISMMLMACPMTALYFLGVALCQWMPRGRNPFRDAYEPS